MHLTCVLSRIYVYDMRSMFFIPLFTVDKARYVSPIAHAIVQQPFACFPSNILGFINLNNSMDSRTLSESLEGFLLPP